MGRAPGGVRNNEASSEGDRRVLAISEHAKRKKASHTHTYPKLKGRNWQKKHDWENLRLSGHAPSTTKRGAQNMADSRSRRQELVEPEACAT